MLHTIGWHTQIARRNTFNNQGMRFGFQTETIRRYGALFGETTPPLGRFTPMLVGTWPCLTIYFGWWLFSTGPLVGLRVE